MSVRRRKQYQTHRERMSAARRAALPWRALNADMSRSIAINYGGKDPRRTEENFLRRLPGKSKLALTDEQFALLAAERIDAGKRQVETVRFRMMPYLDDDARRIELAEAALAEFEAGNMQHGFHLLSLAVRGGVEGRIVL